MPRMKTVMNLVALAAGMITLASAGSAAAATTTPAWVGEGKPSAPPLVPAGLVVKCHVGPTNPAAAALCPVLKWNGHSYWAYSFADNRNALAIVAYDPQGQRVGRWDVTGTRWLNAITVDATARTATFVGEKGTKITRTWDALSPSPYIRTTTPTNPLPALPSDVKVACADGAGAPTPNNCVTMRWGNYTYWAFDYADNRNAMVVVAYDASGAMVKTWNLAGVRGIRSIAANPTTRVVEFTGTGTKASLPWAELFVPANARWEQVAGPPGATIKQVAVGNAGWVWALDTTGVPWRFNGNDWIKGSGTVTAISATADNSLWMSHAGNNNAAGRYKYGTHQWLANVSGGMIQISAVDANKAYGIDASGNNYEWDGSVWVKKSCCVTHIEAGSDGTLWAVHAPNNNAGNRWSGTGWTQTSPEGVAIPRGMTKLSVGDARNIWALDGNGSAYRWSNGWSNLPGTSRTSPPPPTGPSGASTPRASCGSGSSSRRGLTCPASRSSPGAPTTPLKLASG